MKEIYSLSILLFHVVCTKYGAAFNEIPNFQFYNVGLFFNYNNRLYAVLLSTIQTKSVVYLCLLIDFVFIVHFKTCSC